MHMVSHAQPRGNPVVAASPRAPFGLVPLHVAERTGLSTTARALVPILAGHAWRLGYAVLSNVVLASKAGISRATVARALAELEHAQVIRREGVPVPHCDAPERRIWLGWLDEADDRAVPTGGLTHEAPQARRRADPGSPARRPRLTHEAPNIVETLQSTEIGEADRPEAAPDRQAAPPAEVGAEKISPRNDATTQDPAPAPPPDSEAELDAAMERAGIHPGRRRQLLLWLGGGVGPTLQGQARGFLERMGITTQAGDCPPDAAILEPPAAALGPEPEPAAAPAVVPALAPPTAEQEAAAWLRPGLHRLRVAPAKEVRGLVTELSGRMARALGDGHSRALYAQTLLGVAEGRSTPDQLEQAFVEARGAQLSGQVRRPGAVYVERLKSAWSSG